MNNSKEVNCIFINERNYFEPTEARFHACVYRGNQKRTYHNVSHSSIKRLRTIKNKLEGGK